MWKNEKQRLFFINLNYAFGVFSFILLVGVLIWIIVDSHEVKQLREENALSEEEVQQLIAHNAYKLALEGVSFEEMMRQMDEILEWENHHYEF